MAQQAIERQEAAEDASDVVRGPRFFKVEPRYLVALAMPLSAIASVLSPGVWTFLSFFLTFGLVPIVELVYTGSPANLTPEEEARAERNVFFDLLTYANAPLMVLLLVLFLDRASRPETTGLEIAGMIASVGVMCGILGTNVGHELGHRRDRVEKLLGKVLFATTLNLHFTVYHNSWHHKYVATPLDPATARRGESLYAFWVRSMWGNYVGSWRIERDRLAKAGKRWWSPENRMLTGQLVQAALLVGVALVWGQVALLAFLAAALVGHLIYESGNYIEHYGMVRRELKPGVYERCLPRHSWNSNHVLGRVMLYELSRHSDHHFMASRKYQLLRHFEESPQLPHGYPAAILMAAVPPLWFRVVHPLLPARV